MKDLFKISKVVYGAREIVAGLWSNLQKHPVYGRYSELAGWLSISVKVESLRNFFGTTDVNSDSFGRLKSCRRDSIFVMLTQFKTSRMTRKRGLNGLQCTNNVTKKGTNGV